MIMRMSSRQMRSKWEKTNFAIYVKKWGAFCDLVYYDLIRLKRVLKRISRLILFRLGIIIYSA